MVEIFENTYIFLKKIHPIVSELFRLRTPSRTPGLSIILVYVHPLPPYVRQSWLFIIDRT
jgi:hypothetical protein